jgi:hypothetical protein
MNRIRQSLAAASLIFFVSLTTFAGDMNCGYTDPPPPPPPGQSSNVNDSDQTAAQNSNAAIQNGAYLQFTAISDEALFICERALTACLNLNF